MAVILIVEDDMFLRDDAEMMIQDWGHDTLSASDVDEALSLLHSPSSKTQLKRFLQRSFESAQSIR
jgi:DNA-binding NtrC family response regulator